MRNAAMTLAEKRSRSSFDTNVTIGCQVDFPALSGTGLACRGCPPCFAAVVNDNIVENHSTRLADARETAEAVTRHCFEFFDDDAAVGGSGNCNRAHI